MDELQYWGARGGCEGGGGCGFVAGGRMAATGFHNNVTPLISGLPILCTSWCHLLSMVNLRSLGVHCAAILSREYFLPGAVHNEKRTAMAVSHLMVKWNRTSSFYA